jgi:transposase
VIPLALRSITNELDVGQLTGTSHVSRGCVPQLLEDICPAKEVAFMIIVGIDIAKRSHEACLINGSGNLLGKPFSFPNSHAGVELLIKYVRKYNPDLLPIVFGMEATGHYWLPLYSRLIQDGYVVHVINPIQSDSLRNLYIRQTKTDAVDSFLIAEVIRFGRFTQTSLAEPDLIALRQLCRYRFSLVDNISDLKRKVIALLDQVFPEYESLFSDLFGASSRQMLAEFSTPEEFLAVDTDKLAELLERTSRGRFGLNQAQRIQDAARQSFGVKLGIAALSFQLRQLVAQIAFLEEQLVDLGEQISAYYDRFSCTLHTIPGIGKVLASAILSEVGDIHRFAAPEKLVAFAGMDPSLKQSGEFTGSQSHMSKRGSPYLRRAIWLAAFPASKFNPVFAAFYQKKRSEGKAHRVALGAVSRKLLYSIFALLKSGQDYDPMLAR